MERKLGINYSKGQPITDVKNRETDNGHAGRQRARQNDNPQANNRTTDYSPCRYMEPPITVHVVTWNHRLQSHTHTHTHTRTHARTHARTTHPIPSPPALYPRPSPGSVGSPQIKFKILKPSNGMTRRRKS